MQTPEEFAAQMGSALWNGDDAAALIRARDAEVRADERAKVLAGFVEEHTKFWEHDEGTGRLRRSAVGVRHRRLVSPWEPTP